MPIVRPVVLNINKPLGWTSRDVLNKLQSLYSFKHFGHAGTLDPLATGVLIVLVSNATKNQDYYLAKNKQYKTRIFLGATSHTCDLEGPFTLQKPVTALYKNKEELQTKINEYLQNHIGLFSQTVPYFSSTKVNGKELYAYARSGQKVNNLPIKDVELLSYAIDSVNYNTKASDPLPSNPLNIRSKQIVEDYNNLLTYFSNNFSYVDLTLTTGKGFYVRSLALDIGDYLGVGGIMGSLVRSKLGDFSVEDARSMDYFNTLPDLI